jgi:hypothetical protein
MTQVFLEPHQIFHDTPSTIAQARASAQPNRGWEEVENISRVQQGSAGETQKTHMPRIKERSIRSNEPSQRGHSVNQPSVSHSLVGSHWRAPLFGVLPLCACWRTLPKHRPLNWHPPLTSRPLCCLLRLDATPTPNTPCMVALLCSHFPIPPLPQSASVSQQN